MFSVVGMGSGISVLVLCVAYLLHAPWISCMNAPLAEFKTPPIFPSVYKAVQVSYLVLASPASPKSPLRVLQELHAAGEVEEYINTSGIDFGRMSPLDQRAECANVTKIVERELEGIELDVILAKFGKDVKAAERVVRFIRPQLSARAQGAAVKIVASLYCNYGDRDKLSSYAISRTNGISQTTAHKAMQEAKKISHEIESAALKRLRPLFVMGGISRK